LLGTAHKPANSVAETFCIGDELLPRWAQKKGAAEAAPFLTILLQDVLFGLWPKPALP
jgi:hypothetical protein